MSIYVSLFIDKLIDLIGFMIIAASAKKIQSPPLLISLTRWKMNILWNDFHVPLAVIGFHYVASLSHNSYHACDRRHIWIEIDSEHNALRLTYLEVRGICWVGLLEWFIIIIQFFLGSLSSSGL